MTRIPPLSALNAELTVMAMLSRAFPGQDLRPQRAFARAGMSPEELVRLYELVAENRTRRALEVGMASGTSSLVILGALSRNGDDIRLTSIDPFQRTWFGNDGIERLRANGLLERHHLLEEPDYLALPKLLAAQERFDFILVDGYHSFDYTLVDIFFADLLLEPGGVLAVHDSSWPAVFKVLQFLETQKDYHRLSPPPFLKLEGALRKAIRRLRVFGSGQWRAFDERRTGWHTLAAYRKISDRMAPEFHAPA
jgi:predicted O-methyltransferase YrrM